MIYDTNLHDRQAFPLGKAFLLSRFSGLKGNEQFSSRFAMEHGPHLGERPSHFWGIGELRGCCWWIADISTHDFSFTVGVVEMRDSEGGREGERTRTDMAYTSCVLGCGGYRSWGGRVEGGRGRGEEGSRRASALDVRGEH